jgi:hypothetical protein
MEKLGATCWNGFSGATRKGGALFDGVEPDTEDPSPDEEGSDKTGGKSPTEHPLELILNRAVCRVSQEEQEQGDGKILCSVLSRGCDNDVLGRDVCI